MRHCTLPFIFLPPPALPTHIPNFRRLRLSPLLRTTLHGTLADLTATLTLYPLETLKTHLQTTLPTPNPYAGAKYALLSTTFESAFFTFLYTSLRTPLGAARASALASACATVVEAPFAAARDRVKVGLRPNLASWLLPMIGMTVRDVPKEMLEFVSYEILAKHKKEWPWVNGMIAGAFAAGITAPMDTIVTRMVAGGAGKGLWNGLGVRIGREAMASAIFFGVFETLNER